MIHGIMIHAKCMNLDFLCVMLVILSKLIGIKIKYKNYISKNLMKLRIQ